MINTTTRLDELLQILCDPENQPHQFIGCENEVKNTFFDEECQCIEPPPLGVDDTEIRYCGTCNKKSVIDGN
jgi:hypothetical protein